MDAKSETNDILGEPNGPDAHYSPIVDSHIYGINGGAKTPQDWMDVAWAALDQAGFTPEQINNCREAWGMRLPGESEEPPTDWDPNP